MYTLPCVFLCFFLFFVLFFFFFFFFFFSSRRRHTRLVSDWSSDVCSSDLTPRRPASRRRATREHPAPVAPLRPGGRVRHGAAAGGGGGESARRGVQAHGRLQPLPRRGADGGAGAQDRKSVV